MARNLTITFPTHPLPLSRCFINATHRGRIESKDYTAWKAETDAHLVKMHAYLLGYPHRPTLSGPVRVAVFVKRPDKRKRDLDNLNKSALDTLVRNHIIRDDSDIVDLRIRWDDEIAHPAVIEVEAA